jgi:endo-1,4-beta-xylanase
VSRGNDLGYICVYDDGGGHSDGRWERSVAALGVQAHLTSGGFAEGFDAAAYRQFLAEVAERGLKILITEMDVLDDGSPPCIQRQDREVADTYRRYLDVALDEPAVVTLVTFGLSDRYTWLQEDFPREDGAPRRPLPFDGELTPKPSLTALASGLERLPLRDAGWVSARC